MSIRFDCPNCQSLLGASDDHADSIVKCPRCQNTLQLSDVSLPKVAPIIFRALVNEAFRSPRGCGKNHVAPSTERLVGRLELASVCSTSGPASLSASSSKRTRNVSASIGRLAFFCARLSMSLLVPAVTRADLIYNIQNYPSDQSGHTLSGTITTDGTIGTLTAGNIVSWVVTFDGTESFRSTDSGAITGVQSLDATSTSLTLSNLNFGSVLNLGVSISGVEADELFWRNSFLSSQLLYLAKYNSAQLWSTTTPSLGGREPWLIAVPPTIPEPSSLAIAGSAITCGVGFWLKRKRRRQRKIPSQS